jgi:hypothetical protein
MLVALKLPDTDKLPVTLTELAPPALITTPLLPQLTPVVAPVGETVVQLPGIAALLTVID